MVFSFIFLTATFKYIKVSDTEEISQFLKWLQRRNGSKKREQYFGVNITILLHLQLFKGILYSTMCEMWVPHPWRV